MKIKLKKGTVIVGIKRDNVTVFEGQYLHSDVSKDYFKVINGNIIKESDYILRLCKPR